MNWALKFGFGKGVVSIDTSQESLAAFRLIFMAEIWQRFTSDAS